MVDPSVSTGCLGDVLAEPELEIVRRFGQTSWRLHSTLFLRSDGRKGSKNGGKLHFFGLKQL